MQQVNIDKNSDKIQQCKNKIMNKYCSAVKGPCNQ